MLNGAAASSRVVEQKRINKAAAVKQGNEVVQREAKADPQKFHQWEHQVV